MKSLKLVFIIMIILLVSGALLPAGAQDSADGGSKLAQLVKTESNVSSGKIIFEAYKQGDADAGVILKEAFGFFNMALCNIINLVAPELVILGGGFSRAGDVLIELVSREIRDRVLVMPRLAVSELKNQASLIGGIHYLIENTDLLAEL